MNNVDTLTLTRVWIPGSPKTKGSLTVKNSGRNGGKAYVEDTPESVRWRLFMVDRIKMDMRQRGTDAIAPYLGEVWLSAWFYQNVKPADAIRKVAGSGDLDKLVRNLLDALSVCEGNPAKGAGLILDDMQVIGFGPCGKLPMQADRGPGLDLHVWRHANAPAD